jgi:hypothetical protein
LHVEKDDQVTITKHVEQLVKIIRKTSENYS